MSLALADQALRELLEAQYDGEPLSIAMAPPGAGKTGGVVALGALCSLLLHQRVLIGTPTYEQLRSIIARLAIQYPRCSVTAWVPKDRLSAATREFGNRARVVADLRDVDPKAPGIVIAVVAKWRWARADFSVFDLLIVDEAWQVSAADYAQIASLANRHALIGDPGQIDPVVTCNVERWEDARSAPHISAPEALLGSHNPRIIRFPVSRRLPQDTVVLIQPLFYPDLPFVGIDEFPDRALIGQARSPLLRRIVSGASIVGSELPFGHVGERDVDMVEHLMSIARDLLNSGMQIRLHGETRALRASDIGIVAPHVSQVSMLQQASSWTEMLIETANRYQGLERPIMLAWHPLSGRSNPQDFHLDVGRFCVMASRHQVACILAWRSGIDAQLRDNPPIGGRSLTGGIDRVFRGWNAQLQLFRSLGADNRIFQSQTATTSAMIGAHS